jgi:hypothetical protein
VTQEQALDDDAENSDGERRQQQRPPIVHTEILETHVCRKGAEHVEGAVREIHHAQKAKDHRQPETEQCIKRSVDQPQHELAKDRWKGNAENRRH